MKCPNCGRESKGVCKDCYLKKHPITLKDFRIHSCGCGRIRVGGEWLKDASEKTADLIERNLRMPDKIKVKKTIVETRDEGKKIIAEIKIRGAYENQEFKLKLEEQIKKTQEACHTCSRLAGNAYSAILQYRSEGELELDDEQVTQAKKVRGGIDYYIVSLRYARSIASKLKKRGYSTSESYKAYGQRNGKNVFRTSISLKPPPFSPGDIIERKGEANLITKIEGNVETYNLSAKKPSAIAFKKLEEFKKIGELSNIHAGIVSAITPEEVQILDIKTSETHTVKRSQDGDIEQGKEIKILLHRNKCLIVPEYLL